MVAIVRSHTRGFVETGKNPASRDRRQERNKIKTDTLYYNLSELSFLNTNFGTYILE